MPSAKRPEGADGAAGPDVEAIHNRRRQYAAAVESLFLSAALSVAAVGAMTLLFGTYGFGLFVLGPFLLGCVTAFIARRNALHEYRQARDLTLAAAAIGMLGLSAYALEGAICILMASPLVLLVALIGAAVGHAATDPRSRLSVRSIAFIIPLFGVDAVAPPRGQFVSSASIDVVASPRAVWDAVVAMKPIAEPPPAPFRWGLAYPVRGEINGSGVGAIRTGFFSTGIAYERVTEWIPEHRLAFIVLSDPPTMFELSPYAHVHAPHVRGYFRTLTARFTMVSLANHRTRLTLLTTHELDLGPTMYWLPMARWVTEVNKDRVLRHFAHQAEQRAAHAVLATALSDR